MPQALRSPLGGFDFKTFAPHARAASSEMESHYSANAVDIVQSIYGLDIELCGYSRDLRISQVARRVLSPGGGWRRCEQTRGAVAKARPA